MLRSFVSLCVVPRLDTMLFLSFVLFRLIRKCVPSKEGDHFFLWKSIFTETIFSRSNRGSVFVASSLLRVIVQDRI